MWMSLKLQQWPNCWLSLTCNLMYQAAGQIENFHWIVQDNPTKQLICLIVKVISVLAQTVAPQ